MSSNSNTFLVDNVGSAARDFCMLERNFLSHVRLGLLLSLLSSALLLRVRLVPDTDENTESSAFALPMASIQFIAALVAVAAGAWEYCNGYRDLMDMRAFLAGKKPYRVVMALLVAIIVATCIILLVKENES
ncbi:hypothetical protein C8J56DRAFT_802967 [Mycena floridula]|nr:hypothetical protein C8J56DRAFT_802967 [Mycena floridula]